MWYVMGSKASKSFQEVERNTIQGTVLVRRRKMEMDFIYFIYGLFQSGFGGWSKLKNEEGFLSMTAHQRREGVNLNLKGWDHVWEGNIMQEHIS